MKHAILIAIVVLGWSIGCAQAQPAATTQSASSSASLSQNSEIDAVLDALDARGKNLKDFSAKVIKTDTDAASGNDTKLTGTIQMQRLPNDDARLHVVFNRKEINDQPPSADRLEYLLANGSLIDRDYARSIEVTRQVLRPGQKMNLLKLGEGPFPLPLGQDKADVHKMFDVAKLPPGKDDPAADSVHVQLKPKAGTQFESKFSTIDFWVDPASQMPVKIVTQDPNGTTTITTELKDIQVNKGINDDDFKLPPIEQDKWNIRQVPYEQ